MMKAFQQKLARFQIAKPNGAALDEHFESSSRNTIPIVNCAMRKAMMARFSQLSASYQRDMAAAVPLRVVPVDRCGPPRT